MLGQKKGKFKCDVENCVLFLFWAVLLPILNNSDPNTDYRKSCKILRPTQNAFEMHLINFNGHGEVRSILR